MLEPISPELVLVDPELRREVLAQLVRESLVEALPEPGPGPAQTEPAPKPLEPVEPDLPQRPAAPMPLSEVLHRPGQVVPRRRKRRWAPALLPVSLAVNVIVIALSVSDARIAQTTPSSPLAIEPPAPQQLLPKPRSTKKAQRPAATAPKRTTPKRTSPKRTTPKRTGTRSKPRAAKRSPIVRETRGQVEQKMLNAVIQSPVGKLPRALIDFRTGLAKNNLQAVCRRDGGPQSFLCVVRPARHKPGEGLYARYRPSRKGSGVFTWYRYRNG